MRFSLFILANLYFLACLAADESGEDIIEKSAYIESAHLASYEAVFEASSKINSLNLEEVTGAVTGLHYIPNFLTDTELEKISQIFANTRYWPSSHVRQKVQVRSEDMKELGLLLVNICARLKEIKWLDEQIKILEVETTRYGKDSYLAQHKDTHVANGFVVTISIGGPAFVTFVRDCDSKKLSLKIESKSVYIIRESAFNDYTHGVTDVSDRRYIISLFVPKKLGDGHLVLNLDRAK